jgi:competence protein ComEC
MVGKNLALIVNNRLLFSIFGFFLGVFVSSFVHVDLTVLALALLIAISVFIYFWRTLGGDFTKITISIFLFAVLFLCGVFRYEAKNSITPDESLVSQVGKQVSLTSTVISEPVQKENGREYIILAPNGTEKILVRTSFYPEFHYGDQIKFSGKLTIPKNFETDNGRAFDYVSYLRKDNIRYIMSFANGSFVSGGNGNPVASELFKLKRAFLQNLESSLPEPHSSLLGGILLGVQDTMGKDLEDSFRTTGIIHIVVLSGYNITIVAESLIKVFSFLPKNFALGSGVFGIILFAIMVGGTPSVLRASLMALLVLLARATGRRYDIGRALLIAGFFMVLWNPNILVFDTSFQLSFLSTIALIWISPIFEKYLTKIPEKWGFRDIASATISTQLFVLPLLLYKMGQFSLVGFPVNLLVLGTIPATMFFGFITGLFGFLSTWLAFPFALITHFLLSYVLTVVHIFSLLPFASIHIPYFGAVLFWLTYIFYGFLFYRIHQQ